MRTRIVIWLILVATHVVGGAIGWIGGSDRLGAIVAGTIYLPLWPLSKLGVPVFQMSGWIPPPTALGWTAVVVIWLAIWWGVAAGIGWWVARRSRAH